MQSSEDDVLLRCLMLIAQHHGLPATAESLTSGLPLEDAGLTPALLSRACKRAGLDSKIKKTDVETLPRAVCPAIVLLEGNTACLYLGKDASGNAEVIYPDLVETPISVPFDELKAKATGHVCLARPRYKFDDRVKSSDHRREGHWFWAAIRANVRVYRDVIIAAFFINMFALALPLFSMNVYDRVVPNAAFDTLWVMTSGLMVVLVADFILKTLRGHFLDLASRRVDVELSGRIMEQTMGMRLEHRPASVGSFAVNLRSFETLRDFITSATLTTLIDLPFALLFMAVIGWIAPPALVPIAVAVLAIVGFAFYMRRKMEKLTETVYQAGASRNATLIESLTGMDTLKAMGAESIMQKKWEESTRFQAGISVQQRMASLKMLNFTTFCQQAAAILVIVIGVFLISERELTQGGLIAIYLLSRRSVTPFGAVARIITQFQQAKLSLNTLNTLFETPMETTEGEAFVSRDHFRGDIEFKNVTFVYPGSETPSLNNVSFKIKAGEHVAILGRVGSGKSTMTKLTMGLYQPTGGAVLIDGIDLRQLAPREFRNNVGYAPQDITLFHGTLRDNLTMAHRGITDEALLAAADRAGLADFVNRHPRGFDMSISERGDSVSGGQRKCISLARALVHEPNILLMDEPTGSMDHSTEAHVKKKLKEYYEGRTMLLVTHRNALLELVDRILVVDGGRIVADGPRDSVVAALQQGRIGRAG